MKQKPLIPVTVLTGFLGAGKTTLLNHLLSQPHGFKCAIVINEFGAVSIDNQLVVGADEEIVELNNGCLCCRVRGDLIRSLEQLVQKQKRFDYVLVETTGLADPVPVAQTFLTPAMRKLFRLDGFVTVVDAAHLEKELQDAPEVPAQIAFADALLLNKTDLVSAADLNRLEARLRQMNKLARIHRTEKSRIDVAKILNVKARELNAPMEVVEGSLDHAHGHHNEQVRSLFFQEERPLDLKKVETWLSEVINEMGPNIYRSKGILHIQGQPKRVVFQGVQMMFDAQPDRFWNPGEKRQSQLVFIGKELDEAKLRTGLENCRAG